MQVDYEEQITNIFWADAMMRVDYSFFGDVVIFYMTFMTYREYRPLVVFLGLNHHRQIVIFGTAFLCDNTMDSLTRLFETFLDAMSHNQSKTILTQRDIVVTTAVAQVMLDSNHGLCTFQIRQFCEAAGRSL